MKKSVMMDRMMFDLEEVVSARWDGETLIVCFRGGHFLKLSGADADRVWQLLGEKNTGR